MSISARYKLVTKGAYAPYVVAISPTIRVATTQGIVRITNPMHAKGLPLKELDAKMHRDLAQAVEDCEQSARWLILRLMAITFTAPRPKASP